MADEALELELADEEATLALGRALAEALCAAGPRQAVLLYGDLGSGKTTLVRALVEALPHGDQAQVSSPSFNIMNLYPTEPETAHFDLYRLEHAGMDESLLDYLQDPNFLVLVEWAQFLDEALLPGERIDIRWLPAEHGRRIRLTAKGKQAIETLCALK